MQICHRCFIFSCVLGFASYIQNSFLILSIEYVLYENLLKRGFNRKYVKNTKLNILELRDLF